MTAVPASNIAPIRQPRPHTPPRRRGVTPSRALALVLVALALPAAGAAPASAEVSAAVTDDPCFGAAARTADCADPKLSTTVFPTPQDALLEPNAPCQPLAKSNLLLPCRFGARGPLTKDVAMLVGDSHATHWRGAVDVVAQAHGWPAISITRSGCPYNAAHVVIPGNRPTTCRRWNRELLAWVRAHREVATIFTSSRSNARYEHSRARSNYETAVRGYMAAWRSLPAHVRNIFVIRDTPRSSSAVADCVQRAYARRQPAAVVCARARRKAVSPDPAVSAARRMRSERVHVIDLTRFFCDSAHCYPVVGGALVHKDTSHITAVFAQTLGRFMLQIVDEIMQRPARPSLAPLLPDERAFAECLLGERELALQAGGWDKVGADHLARAEECRGQLEQRAAQIKAAGLSGTFNRANRHATIRRVLET